MPLMQFASSLVIPLICIGLLYPVVKLVYVLAVLWYLCVLPTCTLKKKKLVSCMIKVYVI